MTAAGFARSSARAGLRKSEFGRISSRTTCPARRLPGRCAGCTPSVRPWRRRSSWSSSRALFSLPEGLADLWTAPIRQSLGRRRRNTLRPGGILPRLPDARARHHGFLQSIIITARPTKRACAGTIPTSPSPGRSAERRRSFRKRTGRCRFSRICRRCRFQVSDVRYQMSGVRSLIPDPCFLRQG